MQKKTAYKLFLFNCCPDLNRVILITLSIGESFGGKWNPTILNNSLTIGPLTAKSNGDEECNEGLMLTSNNQGFKSLSKITSNPNNS